MATPSIPLEDQAHLKVEVISVLQEAAKAEASPIIDRLRSSMDWIRLSRLFRHSSRLDAYIQTLALSEISVTRGRSLETRLSHLTGEDVTKRTDGLAVNAAACAIDGDCAELAVELLEQGRATLFAQLSRYRTSLEHLKEVNEQLVDEFERLSWLLEGSAVSDGRVPADSTKGNQFEDDIAR